MNFITLGIFATVALVLSLAYPLYSLLVFDFVLVFQQGSWNLAGINLNLTDLAYLGIALGLLLRGRFVRGNDGPHQIPYLGWWFTLAAILSLAYLVAPQNQQYFTDPVRIAYQLYRYAFKPILIYPLTFLLLNDRKKFQVVVLALVVAADLCSISAIRQGYSGLRAGGPFGGGNALGGVLVVPFLFAVMGLLFPASRRHLLFFGFSVPFILRALLFAGSRGAYTAILTGLAFALVSLSAMPEGRRKLLNWAPVLPLVLVFFLALLPTLADRPTLKRFSTLSDPGEVSTLQWRLEQRWPHFWRIALAHPWIGTGTDVDFSLGREGNTPHNGYLSLSVKYGFPATAMFLLFAGLAVVHGLQAPRRAASAEERIQGIAIACAIVAILVHNIVESTLMNPFVAKLFWMLTAIAILNVRRSTGLGQPALRAPAVSQAEAPSSDASAATNRPHLAAAGRREAAELPL